MRLLLLLVSLCCSNLLLAQHRWTIHPDRSIGWNIMETNIPHYDHIEMSGEQVSTVLRYGVKADGSFSLERSLVWPMLRTVPNNTHASLMQRFSVDVPSLFIVNGLSLTNEKVKSVQLNGALIVVSNFAIGYANVGAARMQEPKPVVELTRKFFPSTKHAMLCERYTVKNVSDKPIELNIPRQEAIYTTNAQKGVDGSYTMLTAVLKDGVFSILPGQTLSVDAYVQAYKQGQSKVNPDMDQEEAARRAFVNEVWSKLDFESPDAIINTAFAFAKIRASESIYRTKGGLMHGPGGESYYAAIWANDQAEYVNPFFPFLGYATGNESALNSFKHFARFMNDEYKPIPSSIIAEGTDIWNGAKDRGDGAMIAYGAARYALARGSKQEAEELWPLITWCLEFCNRKINEHGVVASDTDELEGRFPAGEANLCTSGLYYDALLSAAYLGKELGKPAKQLATYKKQAEALHTAINKFFGANVEGFETYRYYEGNDVLRSWICIPLTVGIFERKEGTITALFSPRLWTKDGLLTQAGSATFWDRSTLYALRGVYAAGATDKANEYMLHYSTQRLLGDHVPYPIEAWPEGNQRHLSAESGLYCRIVTEGIFGIRPTGLRSFSMTPRLPATWDTMRLKNVEAFGAESFDIEVTRKGDKLITNIVRAGKTIRTFTSVDGKILQVQL